MKARGLLEETLVLWITEFGRMPSSQAGRGRDHNPYVFTNWLCGGGIQGGITYGETDPVGYSAAIDPVQLRDLHATVLNLLGLDHQRLSIPFQGLDQKLTGAEPARVVNEILV